MKRKYKNILFISLLIVISFFVKENVGNAVVLPNNPVYVWTENKYVYEEYTSIIENDKGGYVVVGGSFNDRPTVKYGTASIQSFRDDNTLISKKSWNVGNYSFFHNVNKDQNNNFVAVGFTTSNTITDFPSAGNPASKEKAVLVKYDENLNVIWEKYWDDGNQDCNARFYGVEAVSDGYIVVGTFGNAGVDTYNGIVVKYDLNGNLIWQTTIGGSRYDQLLGIAIKDNYIYAAGSTVSNDIFTYQGGAYDCLYVKIALDGTVVWQKNYGGTNQERFNNIRVIDGEIYAVGYIKSTIKDIVIPGKTSGVIVKFNEDGDITWAHAVGGEDAEHLTDVTKVDGNLLVSGRASSTIFDASLTNSFDYQPFLALLNPTGDILDSKVYKKNSNTNNEIGISKLTYINNNILGVGAYTTGDLWDGIIVRIDASRITTTYDSTLGSVTVPEVGKIGDEIEITVNPTTGYELDTIEVKNKNGDIIPLTSNKFTMPINDVFVSVTFKKKTFNITGSVEGGVGGSITPTSSTKKYQETETLTITTEEGYQIRNIKANGTDVTNSLIGNELTLTITEDTNVIVEFEKIRFTVTTTAGSGGDILPLGSITIDYGSDFVLDIVANEGYDLESVIVNGIDKTSSVSNNKLTVEGVTANTSITVTFTIKRFDITTKKNGEGTITVNGNTKVTWDDAREIIIEPDLGYKINEVKVNGIVTPITNNKLNIEHIKENILIEVTFVKINYNIYISSNYGGVVHLVGDSVINYNDTRELVITLIEGYEIKQVKVNDSVVEVSDNKIILKNIQTDLIIDIEFGLINYQIKIDDSSNGTTTVEGTSYVEYDGTKEITFNPDFGYKLDKVYVNDIETSISNNKLTLTHIKENIEIKVSYIKINYSILKEKGYSFIVNNNKNNISSITINGVTLNIEDYTIEGENDFILTIKESFLNTLPENNYNLVINYIDGGESNISFINDSTNNEVNPQTNDNVFKNITIFSISLLIMIVILIYFKKEFKRN